MATLYPGEKPPIQPHSTGAGRFRSTRITKEQHKLPEQQWTLGPDGRRVRRRSHLVFLIGVLFGTAMAALKIGLAVWHHFDNQGKYCLVMEDHFDGPLNTSLWRHEVSVGGSGNREFQWTTSSSNNSYTEDGKLYITPTLTADSIGYDNVVDGYTLNLTADGSCTTPEAGWSKIDYRVPMQIAINSSNTNCQQRSNATLGTVIQPVQSARLNTNGTAGIRYGRVEVRLRAPTGDWLWPAVWLMPEASVYGTWPKSGEIDMFETRGNLPKSRMEQKVNTLFSTIHVGYSVKANLQRQFLKQYVLWRDWFNQGYHTIGLEWDEKELWTWTGNRNRRVLQVKFDRKMIDRVPKQYDDDGTYIAPPNPWLTSDNLSAPFDQRFYLIINLAVGGGFFQDGPWSAASPNPAAEFWRNRAQWLPTWPKERKERSLVVDYVKMWQRC